MRLFEQNNSINHELPELYPRSIPPQVVGPEMDSCQGTGRFNQPLVPLLKCQGILESDQEILLRSLKNLNSGQEIVLEDLDEKGSKGGHSPDSLPGQYSAR